MNIHVTTSTQELAEMQMSASQLRESIVDCLSENGADQAGERMDYASFSVEVEVMTTVKEFVAAAVSRPQAA